MGLGRDWGDTAPETTLDFRPDAAFTISAAKFRVRTCLYCRETAFRRQASLSEYPCGAYRNVWSL